MTDGDRFAQLMARLEYGSITPEEKIELQALINSSPDFRRVYEERLQPGQMEETTDDLLKMNDRRIWGSIAFEIYSNDKTGNNQRAVTMAQRLRVWIPAAIIFLTVCMLCVLKSMDYIKERNVSAATVKGLATFRKAMGDAILILDNDKPISLGQQSMGEIARRYGLIASRTGKYVFSLQHAGADNGFIEKASSVLVSVPYGQSWDVTLPDGTFVKLGPGAVLSLRGHDRDLQLDGEAYFEVAQDMNRPFRLSTTRGNVDVLGTSFNVRSFSDEKRSVTTLVSGSVRVWIPGDEKKLLPGEEANIEQGRARILVVSGVDTTDRLAWRSPYFTFTDQSIPAVMKQVQRWYGLKDVVYRPGVDTITKGLLGGGHIGKDISLHRLLEELEIQNRISFSIHDKTIIVGPMAYTSFMYVLPLQ
jgi:hypothetical protein